MRLTDKENFEINCGGVMEEQGEFPKLEDCLNLKISGIIEEEKGKMPQ